MIKALAAALAALMLPLSAAPQYNESGGSAPQAHITAVYAVRLAAGDACQPDMVLLDDGTVLLPFVSVSIAAGYTHVERSDEGAISVSNGSRRVTAAPGQKYICVDDHYIWLGEEPHVDMDELLLPIDAICQALGLESTWEKDILTISLSQDASPHTWPERDPHMELWLARIIWAEARGECLEGQIAVAQVVLNRMGSPYYPDTVTGVLFQPYQFSTVDSGAIWNDANDQCYLAARLALDGADIVGGDCLYFNSCSGKTPGLSYICTIGGHKFYAR